MMILIRLIKNNIGCSYENSNDGNYRRNCVFDNGIDTNPSDGNASDSCGCKLYSCSLSAKDIATHIYYVRLTGSKKMLVAGGREAAKLTWKIWKEKGKVHIYCKGFIVSWFVYCQKMV